MAETVYLLCAATSVMCAWLLLRGYRQRRTRLLFWSSTCFMGLALNNLLLFVDEALTAGMVLHFAGIEVAIWRAVIALVSVSLLVYGLIADSEQDR